MAIYEVVFSSSVYSQGEILCRLIFITSAAFEHRGCLQGRSLITPSINRAKPASFKGKVWKCETLFKGFTCLLFSEQCLNVPKKISSRKRSAPNSNSVSSRAGLQILVRSPNGSTITATKSARLPYLITAKNSKADSTRLNAPPSRHAQSYRHCPTTKAR